MVPQASAAVRLAFVVLAVAVAGLFAAGVPLASRRLGEPLEVQRRLLLLSVAGTAAWMLATGVLAASGVLADFERRPPPLLAVFVSALTLPLVIGFSPLGARLARGLPIAALVGAQAFRIPLEIAMHQAARENVMPTRMSFAGTNFDIVTGAGAIVVAALTAHGPLHSPAVRNPTAHSPALHSPALRAVIATWNVVGSALLANVLVTGVLASPMIHAFGTDPRDLNTFVAYFPFVWLPTVLVAAAALGHIAVGRALRT
ncbi:MAG TPA: hypothetical protein VEK07_23590 [Polyangiaceae bacterium]|nr:hypothetical protein [Polyangiaceae bacterium]